MIFEVRTNVADEKYCGNSRYWLRMREREKSLDLSFELLPEMLYWDDLECCRND